MQALQVGAQIANQQVQQMQKLRQLVMSQMNMQANFMAAEAAKDAAKQARAERFWDTNRGTQVGDERSGTWPLRVEIRCWRRTIGKVICNESIRLVCLSVLTRF